jgi:hypothetical protein
MILLYPIAGAFIAAPTTNTGNGKYVVPLLVFVAAIARRGPTSLRVALIQQYPIAGAFIAPPATNTGNGKYVVPLLVFVAAIA